MPLDNGRLVKITSVPSAGWGREPCCCPANCSRAGQCGSLSVSHSVSVSLSLWRSSLRRLLRGAWSCVCIAIHSELRKPKLSIWDNVELIYVNLPTLPSVPNNCRGFLNKAQHESEVLWTAVFGEVLQFPPVPHHPSRPLFLGSPKRIQTGYSNIASHKYKPRI